MRRKTFDVLFDTSAGMAVLTKQPCLWRSAFYFTLSVGFFTGVTTNCWLLEQELAVRLAIIIAVVIITATALTLYGFLLHGIMETFGALAGDPVALICLLGYTTLPFLVLTPGALLAGKLGWGGLPLLGALLLVGCLWMLYLLVRALEAVYLIDSVRAGVTLLFSLLLLYIVFILPWQLGFTLLLRSF
ncbi:YIP1 family protein [Phascolarctobacterium sp.]|uniref:YIP1 family protein n=1 Tax=Phascolarctobacterium sp. TaxID=2049039 RepID=UPI0025D25622|nr:YIP1 family protein [Phascolarctobacterium sp.]